MKSTLMQSRNMESMAKSKLRHLHNVVAVLAVLAGLAVFSGPAEATAQNVAESRAQLNGCHPQGPEGSWLYTVTIPGYTFQGIGTYSAGGGYTEADQLSFSPIAVASAGHGAWKMAGEKTFVLTYLILTFDAFSSGNPTGTLKVRQNTRIEDCGNSYTGSGDYTYHNLNGNPIPAISGTFTITATRILVQAPQ